MTDFDTIAGALRGEALRETAAALFAALSGSAGAMGFGGEDAETARGGIGFAPGGAAARREVGAARFAAESVPVQAAETAEVRRRVSAELGGIGGAVYGAAVEGSGGGMTLREARSRTAEAARSEGFGAEALSEAVRRDSRRYDRRLE